MDSNSKQPGVGRGRVLGHPVVLAAPLALALAVLGLFALGHARAAAPKEEPAPLLVRDGERIKVPASSPLRSRLAVAEVTASAAAHALALPAVVEADPALTVNILPPLTGKLMALPVRLGDVVRANQLLAVIGSPDLAQAYADADKARDALDLAERALERARGVNQAGASAAKDLEQAQSNEVQAAAEFKRAQTRLTALGVADPAHARPAPLEVRAPVAGTITSLNIGLGSFINDPTVAIMTLANLTSVWVTASVPETAVASVTRGLVADVELPGLPGQVLHGKVEFVSPVLDPDTRRAKARIVFRNVDGRLKPNMYATVTFALPQSSQAVLPASALLMNNDSTTVFVETEPWVFVRRVVTIGTEDGESVRIQDGVKPGERVVVRGGILLND